MPRREASIAPLRAQRVLAAFGLRLAPALTAGAIVASHTGRVGDGLLAAVAVLIVVRAVDRGRRYAQLMPAAGMVGAVLAPLVGIGLAWLVSLAFEPLPGHAVFPAMLGTLLVTALGAWLVTRFEQVAEIRIAVVGSASTARDLAAELARTVGGYRVVGWVDRGVRVPADGVRRLGPLENLGEIVTDDAIDLVVDGGRERAAASVADVCVGLDVRLIGLNRLYEDLIGHVPLATLDGAFFQYLMHPRYRGGSRVAKRATDLALGGLAAVLLAPVVAVAALTLRLQGAPALERRRLVGARGQEFSVLRLRTRRTWLAVAPMLVNVLRGQMTLVGPRADRSAELAALKPGLTGWAQLRSRVSEGADSSWSLSHDLYYLKHRSTTLDAMILLQTLITVGQALRLPEPAADEALAQAN